MWRHVNRMHNTRASSLVVHVLVKSITLFQLMLIFGVKGVISNNPSIHQDRS